MSQEQEEKEYFLNECLLCYDIIKTEKRMSPVNGFIRLQSHLIKAHNITTGENRWVHKYFRER